MSDKELLELAAKAMGKTARWSPSLEDWQKDLTPPYVDVVVWDPQNDDGDALRLAVELNLLHGNVFARGVTNHHRDGGDIYAATRRAIVLAAAEIGRELP